MGIMGHRSVLLFLTGIVLLGNPLEIPADETLHADQLAYAVESDDDAPVPPAKPKVDLSNGLQIQPNEDKLELLKPVKPRSADEQMRVEALTWFSVGRMRLKRGQNQTALEAFQNAYKHDPQSVAILESLIAMSITLNRVDDAIDYSKKLVEVAPDHFHSLQILGRHLAQQGKIPEAIKMLERAIATVEFNKHSENYVRLMRDLGILYRATSNAPKASEAFAVVFDAIENPDQYELPDNVRRQLMADVMTNYEQLGDTFYQGKNYELAISAYQRAIETKTGNIGNVIYHLALAYLESDQPDKAMEELQAYFDAQRQTQGRKAYELLGVILESQGKSDQFLPKLRVLAERDRRNEKLQFFLAETLLSADALEEAEQVLTQALERSKDPEGFAVLAGIYHKQNRPNELLHTLARAYAGRNQLNAIEAELKAIAEDKELTASVIAEGRKLNEEEFDFAHAYVLANLAERAEEKAQAEEFYRTALTKTRVAEQKNSVYLELSDLLRSQRKFTEAAEALRQGVDDPAFIADLQTRVLFYYWLSYNLELAGQTEAALEAIGEGMKLAGRPNGILKLRDAWIYYHSERNEEAIQRFEAIIKDFANDDAIVRSAKSNLSNLYVQMGDQQKGEEILEEVYRENPTEPGINNDLGYLYADQGKNLEQAEKMIRIAIESDPDNAAYLDSMGWVLYKREKFEEALPYLKKASEEELGQDGTIYDHLGDVYQRLGKIDLAVEAWKKALELSDVDTKTNKKLIERLNEKLKNHQSSPGELRPERPDSP